MNRVLFVDDEARVLSGLRRQLFARRGEWDMAFVESGPAALEDLARTPAAAVVSDMRMPGMDGAQLLLRVAQEHPRAARLVLSGQADPDRVQVARACAHRILQKPCPPETLQAEIARALSVRAALDAAAWPLAEALWHTPPAADAGAAAAMQAMAESADAAAVAAEVERQLTSDPWLRPRVETLAGAGAPPRALLTLILALRFAERFAADGAGRATALATRAARIAAAEKLPPEAAVLAAAAAVLAPVGQQAGLCDARGPLLDYLLPGWGLPDPVVAATVHLARPASCPPSLAAPLALLCGAELLLGWADAPAASSERMALLEGWLKERGWDGAHARWPDLVSRPA